MIASKRLKVLTRLDEALLEIVGAAAEVRNYEWRLLRNLVPSAAMQALIGAEATIAVGTSRALASVLLRRTACAWWGRLDDTSRPDLWSGTFASSTRVPATLLLGSRVWVRRNQVLEHKPAESQ